MEAEIKMGGGTFEIIVILKEMSLEVVTHHQFIIYFTNRMN
jgi:hypothetical protein